MCISNALCCNNRSVLGSQKLHIILYMVYSFCSQPPPVGQWPIEDLTDPYVMGAACAAADYITAMSNSVYKSVLVTITNGTQQVRRVDITLNDASMHVLLQVVSGIKYDTYVDDSGIVNYLYKG